MQEYLADKVGGLAYNKPDMEHGTEHGHLFSVVCFEGTPLLEHRKLMVTTEYTHIGTDGLESDMLDDDIPLQTLKLRKSVFLKIAEDINKSGQCWPLESVWEFLPKYFIM